MLTINMSVQQKKVSDFISFLSNSEDFLIQHSANKCYKFNLNERVKHRMSTKGQSFHLVILDQYSNSFKVAVIGLETNRMKTQS